MNFVRFKPYGRPAHEGNDCTVRALVAVSGARYAEAHALARDLGRVDGKPFDVREFVGGKLWRRAVRPAFKRVRVSFARLPHVICGQRGFSARALNLAEFVARNPVGVFYVCTRDHAFAIRNGAVVDLRPGLVSADSEIDSAWRVSP